MTDKKINDQKQIEKKKPSTNKETYIKPEILSEDLLAYAASCNGTTVGNRKAATGAPNFCNSRRLNS